MGLRSKYDPQSDRMLLMLETGEGVSLSYWVTRRQWLGVIHALRDVPVAPESPTLPSRQRRLSVNESAVEPVLLKGLRLRRKDDTVKLIFVTGHKQGVGIDLRPAGVAQLQSMLRQQAERAGWDVAAALARLNVAAMTSAAVAKASKLH